MTVAPEASVLALQDATPDLARTSFVAAGARIVGAVDAGATERASGTTPCCAPTATRSRSGAGSNIQDNVSVHVDPGTRW